MKIVKIIAKSSTILSVLLMVLAAAQLLALPTAQSQATPAYALGHAPTFVGSASEFLLSGPTTVTPSLVAQSASIAPSATALTSGHRHNRMKPRAGTTSAAPAVVSVPPTVSCPGHSCDAVSTSAGGATTQPVGLNAYNDLSTFGFDSEPADQGLCAGNGYVMEVNNGGELQIFAATTLSPGTYITLDNLMGLTALQWSSGGDPSCLYDYDNGGHWFVTEIVSKTPEANAGPFTGCFAGVLDTCLEGIAVSVTNNPTGAYNVYFFDPNTVNSDPGKGYLLNDFGKIGNTKDALLFFYDEFNQNSATYPTCPAYGCNSFNGAQEFAFDKSAFEQGLATSSPSFNVAYENMGLDPSLYPIPANPPFQPTAASCFSGAFAGAVCWYAVIPAQSTDATQYDNRYGGSGFMLGGIDYFGLGDNRIGTFYWTGLSYLSSSGCSACNGIKFGEQVLTNLQPYLDEGASCLASGGGTCGLGQQKTGPIPLGDNCGLFGAQPPTTVSCPENGIATNGDYFTQVSYARHQIWGALPTLITQTYTSPPSNEIHVGAAYWVVGTSTFDSGGTFTLTGQGYVTAMHEDMEFPAIAGGGASAVMTFTLSGPDYYPSTAYGKFTATSNGLSPTIIHVADLGMAPEDGFTEYYGYPPTSATTPRWGDYSWAIYDPVSGTAFFATNYIQSPACSNFVSNPTCGGTRGPLANWGTSVNFVTP